MNYLNKSLASWAANLSRDCSFSLILAFDYYDGPEAGLAFFDSGEGAKFSALGDSRSRHFRAFELLAICGNWSDQINAIQASTGMREDCRVIFPQDGDNSLISLEMAVSVAEVSGRYIGIGSPNFEWLYVVTVTDEEIVAMHQLGSTEARFDQAHKILKRNKRNNRGQARMALT